MSVNELILVVAVCMIVLLSMATLAQLQHYYYRDPMFAQKVHNKLGWIFTIRFAVVASAVFIGMVYSASVYEYETLVKALIWGMLIHVIWNAGIAGIYISE